MDERELDYAEENLARLLRAALEGEARPEPGLRQEVWRRLQAKVHSRAVPAAFPDAVVLLLGGILLCAVLGLVLLAATGQASLLANPALGLLSAGVALNLLLLPIAGAIVILGRRHGRNA